MAETTAKSVDLNDQAFLRRLRDLRNDFLDRPLSANVASVVPSPLVISVMLTRANGDVAKARKKARYQKKLAELDDPTPAGGTPAAPEPTRADAPPVIEVMAEPPSALVPEIAAAVDPMPADVALAITATADPAQGGRDIPVGHCACGRCNRIRPLGKGSCPECFSVQYGINPDEAAADHAAKASATRKRKDADATKRMVPNG